MIQATTEMVKGLTDIAVCVAQVVKDGKVDFSDFGALMGLLAKQAELTSAVKDAVQIPAEIKDLSDDEVKELVQMVLDAIHAVKAA